MSDEIDRMEEIEERMQALLTGSLAHIDATTRSRLNQARQRALAAMRRPRRLMSFWRGSRLMQMSGGAVAAILVTALILRGSGSHPAVTAAPSSQPSLEVIDLVTSGESMSLMENYDHGFYEWAAAQAGDSKADPTHAKPTT